jgi:DNA-binding CsgD family transcriptional regulator
MVANKIKELEAAKTKIAQLEKSIADEMAKELAALPAKFGFTSPQAFLKAVNAATRGKRGGRKAAKAAKRSRAVITADTKAKVKELVAGGKTGGHIAKALKISVPSVQNIKKELGLVKARK